MIRRVLPCFLATGLALAGCATTRPAPAAPAPATEMPPLGRLPPGAEPKHYALALQIDPDAERFSGHETIDVELAQPTDRLWIHGKGLQVTEASITPEGGAAQVVTYEQRSDEGVALVRWERALGPGKVQLQFAWNAAWGAQVEGLYRVTDAGAHYVFSQFEPLFARRCFPSFDEPRFKTPFDVTLTVPHADDAVANAPVEEEQHASNELRTLRFQQTPPLPTYLVAFAVGPFDVVQGPLLPPAGARKDPLQIRGIATKGKGARLAYAVAHAAPLLLEEERYFGIGYPYAKLDLLAVPDFAAGAMENAGAITFREALLLMDDPPPADQRRSFAFVTAHELAHQWFGDLVTLAWWEDLWLNEGFASWMGDRTVQQVDPSMKAEVAFREGVQRAMDADLLVSTRRIRQPITSSHDIHSAFDSITYAKGAALLAMLESYVGPERFQQAIHRYLEQHRFQSVHTEAFARALREAGPQDVGEVLDSFLEQPGVPLVDVTVACEGEQARLRVAQSRTLPVGSTGDRSLTWTIPLCVRLPDGARECHVVRKAEETIPLQNKGCPRWVMPNADAAGYYLFKLDPEHARALAEARDALGLTEQLSFVASIHAAEESGALLLPDAITALAPFVRSPERSLLRAPMGYLDFARTRLVPESLKPKVEAYSRALYAPVAEEARFDLPLAGDEAKLRRRDLASFLVLTGRDAQVRADARRHGRAYAGLDADGALHPEAVDPVLASLALGVALEEGSAQDFEKVVAILKRTTSAEVRSKLLSALAHAPGPLAERARQLAFDSNLRANEAGTVLWVQLSIPEQREALWRFVTANYDRLVERLPEEFVGSLPWMASGLCGEAPAKEVEAFSAPRIQQLPGGPRNLAEAVEEIRLCGALVDAHRSATRDFFEAQH